MECIKITYHCLFVEHSASTREGYVIRPRYRNLQPGGKSFEVARHVTHAAL